MFKSISWQQFINTGLIVIGGYYIISVLLLYSKEIIQKLKGGSVPKIDQPILDRDLMGKIKSNVADEYEHSVEGKDLNISGAGINNENALLVGSVSDLLHEVKTLFKVIKEGNGTDRDAVNMITTLLSNYAFLNNTKYLDSINLFIQDQFKNEFSIHIELTDLNKWWPVTESTN